MRSSDISSVPSPTPSPIQTPTRQQAGHAGPTDKGKGRAQPLHAQTMERSGQAFAAQEMEPNVYVPREQAANTNEWLRAMAPPPLMAVPLLHPQPTTPFRGLTVPESLAAPDPWGPYAATPVPEQTLPQIYLPPRPIPLHFEPREQAFGEPPVPPPGYYQPNAPPLGIVPAGPLPNVFSFAMPSDPINQQHGPVVPEAVLGQLSRGDGVENMNAPFPFMFAPHRPVGAHSPVFVSDNGHMQYYAWGDYRGVAMLTMTVPVHRMQELRMQADAETLALQQGMERKTKRAHKRPSRAKTKGGKKG